MHYDWQPGILVFAPALRRQCFPWHEGRTQLLKQLSGRVLGVMERVELRGLAHDLFDPVALLMARLAPSSRRIR